MREIYAYAEHTRSNINASSKKYAMRWLSLRIATYLIEYLGEFGFIFETILDYESGDQMGSFDAKTPPSKISCLGTFKEVGAEIFSRFYSSFLMEEAL